MTNATLTVTNATLTGKPDAGNPHDRFDEGKVAPTMPRRGSLLSKRILALAAVVGGVLGASAEYGRGFATRFDLDPTGSHVQGICTTTDAVYFAQNKFLYACDWNGNLLRKITSVNHTGDLCWYEGKLYASICLSKPFPNGDRGLIIVYDGDLNEIRRSPSFPRPADGIVRLGDTLYVGLGSDAPKPRLPHRKNFLAAFDAETLTMRGELKSYDYGFDTRWGVQDITTDGTNLLLMFYGTTTSAIVTDRNYRLIRKIDGFMASNGLDPLASDGKTKGVRFLRATTHDHVRSGSVRDRRFRVCFDVVSFDGEKFTVEK